MFELSKKNTHLRLHANYYELEDKLLYESTFSSVALLNCMSMLIFCVVAMDKIKKHIV
jgi:hypothetical protein